MRLPLLFLLAGAFVVSGAETPAGRWEGEAKIPGRELRLIVDFEAAPDGQWKGSIIFPGLNIAGATLSDIRLDGAEVAFAITTALADSKSGPAKFNARLADGGKMAGEFVQGGNRAPFTLTKIGPPQVATSPRSTAIAKEIEGEWKGGYELFGYPRKVTIKLQNRGAEGATADFLIVGKKENRLPVDLVTQEGNFLEIYSHETGLSFEGRVGKDQIKGMVLQGPLEISVTMTRVN